jgi:hypothetical protein
MLLVEIPAETLLEGAHELRKRAEAFASHFNIPGRNERVFTPVRFKPFANQSVVNTGFGMNPQRQMDMIAHHAEAKDIDEKELRLFAEQENEVVLVGVV